MDNDGFLSILECFCLLPELEKSLPQPKSAQQNVDNENGPPGLKGPGKGNLNKAPSGRGGKWGKRGMR